MKYLFPTPSILLSHFTTHYHLPRSYFWRNARSCKFFSLGLFFRFFSSCHRSRFRFRRLFVQEPLKQQQLAQPSTCHVREDKYSKTSVSSNNPEWRANGK